MHVHPTKILGARVHTTPAQRGRGEKLEEVVMNSEKVTNNEYCINLNMSGGNQGAMCCMRSTRHVLYNRGDHLGKTQQGLWWFQFIYIRLIKPLSNDQLLNFVGKESPWRDSIDINWLDLNQKYKNGYLHKIEKVWRKEEREPGQTKSDRRHICDSLQAGCGKDRTSN